jgi:hypothetical protein
MVIEGKSYATGKPVFEAQNRAAVSGSCMTNLQHKLADLTERASPGSYQRKAPLAFSKDRTWSYGHITLRRRMASACTI